MKHHNDELGSQNNSDNCRENTLNTSDSLASD